MIDTCRREPFSRLHGGSAQRALVPDPKIMPGRRGSVPGGASAEPGGVKVLCLLG